MWPLSINALTDAPSWGLEYHVTRYTASESLENRLCGVHDEVEEWGQLSSGDVAGNGPALHALLNSVARISRRMVAWVLCEAGLRHVLPVSLCPV